MTLQARVLEERDRLMQVQAQTYVVLVCVCVCVLTNVPGHPNTFPYGAFPTVDIG